MQIKLEQSNIKIYLLKFFSHYHYLIDLLVGGYCKMIISKKLTFVFVS